MTYEEMFPCRAQIIRTRADRNKYVLYGDAVVESGLKLVSGKGDFSH